MNYVIKANFKLENSTLSKHGPVFFCFLEQTQKVANLFQKTPKPLITTITQNMGITNFWKQNLQVYQFI